MRYQHLKQFQLMHFIFQTAMITFQQLNGSQNLFAKGEKTFWKLRRVITFLTRLYGKPY